jgi:hypothetical protein
MKRVLQWKFVARLEVGGAGEQDLGKAKGKDPEGGTSDSVCLAEPQTNGTLNLFLGTKLAELSGSSFQHHFAGAGAVLPE